MPKAGISSRVPGKDGLKEKIRGIQCVTDSEILPEREEIGSRAKLSVLANPDQGK